MSGLLQSYDEIKAGSKAVPLSTNPMTSIGPGNPTLAWKNQVNTGAENLKDECVKRLIIDIYCKVLPLDSSYIQGNQGLMRQDIDNMLATKGMTPRQYITSAHEKTKAPLLEFILRSCDNIGKWFVEEAEEIRKDGEKAGINPPVPDEKNVVEDEETMGALIDIQKDDDYGSFVDMLKKRTVEKIVDDISELIVQTKTGDVMNPKFADETTMESGDTKGIDHNDLTEEERQRRKEKLRKGQSVMGSREKEKHENEKNRPRTPQEIAQAERSKKLREKKTESAIATVYDYVVEKLLKENVEITSEMNEEIIGMAIRESTLNLLDLTFKQPMSDYTNFRSNILFGKGIVVNENTVSKYTQEDRESYLKRLKDSGPKDFNDFIDRMMDSEKEFDDFKKRDAELSKKLKNLLDKI